VVVLDSCDKPVAEFRVYPWYKLDQVSYFDSLWPLLLM
jgi:hypothetical protein